MPAPSRFGSSGSSKASHPKPSRMAEARRQSRAVAASTHSRADQAFIDAVSELGDE